MANRKISVFYDGSHFTFKWLKALLWAEDEFRKHGVGISFIRPTQYFPFKSGRNSAARVLGRGRFDALFVAHHHSLPLGIAGLPHGELKLVLEELKNQSDLLVWLDTADSTGTCRFDVMPYVDLYFKKQVLRQRHRYYRPIWGGRLFCEYYHAKYGIEDPEISELDYPVLDPKYLDKMRISWNLGLSDLFTRNKYQKLCSYVRPRKTISPDFASPFGARTIDVHFRGSAWSSAAGWQRAKTRELLTARNDVTFPDVSSKVSYDRYIGELKSSRAVVSPFGWGEVCFRDFEAFAFGAVLLKPSMAHIETFPDWFVPDETYVEIDWDFKNFNEVLDGIRDKSADYFDIARRGQEMYMSHMLGNTGKVLFARHVLTNLGWL